jgi:quercetin dioxygenase-like cupin family protein
VSGSGAGCFFFAFLFRIAGEIWYSGMAKPTENRGGLTMSYYKVSDLRSKEISEGITLRAVAGNKTMITFVEFQPHAVLPKHRHSHEQITFVLAGELEFELDGKKKLLKQGEGAVIPPHAEHGARVLNHPASVLDAWYPIREDYL